jgi:hypothetical protein
MSCLITIFIFVNLPHTNPYFLFKYNTYGLAPSKKKVIAIVVSINKKNLWVPIIVVITTHFIRSFLKKMVINVG